MDSKFEKWNELPPEMRLECVKWMGFETRMQLRGASKSDKSLIESAPKYHFDKVTMVFLGPDAFRTVIKFEDFKLDGIKDRQVKKNAVNLAVQILKFANVDNLKYHALNIDNTQSDCDEFYAKIANLGPFQFKTLELDTGNLDLLKFFARNCENIERIALKNTHECERDESLGELFDIPTVRNTKTLMLVYLANCERLCKIMENWIQNDVELGKTLQILPGSYHPFLELVQRLDSYVVSKKRGGEVRLKMANPAKHILIRTIKNTVRPSDYISFVVIPADQKESEYEKDDQWTEDYAEKTNMILDIQYGDDESEEDEFELLARLAAMSPFVMADRERMNLMRGLFNAQFDEEFDEESDDDY